MSSYRCFAIDLNGHICATEIIDCDGDAAAVVAAQALWRRHPAAQCLEVWDRDRRVAVLTRPRRDAA